MSRRNSDKTKCIARRHAPVFAALGDETRLALLLALCASMPMSITRLTEGSTLTRQAITKHLQVLEDAGMVHSVRAGRETLFQLRPKPLGEAVRLLDSISQQWDQALARLKAFVEE
jgi:DNA-binding transcriptional ArsR family regulator